MLFFDKLNYTLEILSSECFMYMLHVCELSIVEEHQPTHCSTMCVYSQHMYIHMYMYSEGQKCSHYATVIHVWHRGTTFWPIVYVDVHIHIHIVSLVWWRQTVKWEWRTVVWGLHWYQTLETVDLPMSLEGTSKKKMPFIGVQWLK